VTDAGTTAQLIPPPLQLVRLPVDKPQPAVDFLLARSNGVMDLIAHFWERLPQTPPLHREDLHLVVAAPNSLHSDLNININKLDWNKFSGAMLYVPKAHRADVLALDAPTAAAFASYITYQGPKAIRSDNHQHSLPISSHSLPLTDLSNIKSVASEVPGMQDPGGGGNKPPSPARGLTSSVPIDFLTGHADGIRWMTPLLLAALYKRSPARQLINTVMQLPPTAVCASDSNVRLAVDNDIPTLNRWRRQYKEERGILFDANIDASVESGHIFVYEHDKQVVSVAKLDLELARLIEIGGVYTFPEFRHKGFGAKIVSDLAARIRQLGKIPTLQVDYENGPALRLYIGAGWVDMGPLARVWITG
jgi:GNAT superfamily N-acetyltransferase